MKSTGKAPSIRKNYVFNIGLTIMNILFPMATIPYLTRVLGPEGIGKFNIASNLSGYFMIIAGMGIPVYGIKEIARNRDDRDALSRVFSSLFIISVAAALSATLIYLSFFLFSSKFQKDSILYLIVGINILFNMFSIDWFYQGIENYPYITLRSLIVKAVSLALVFITVHVQNDYIIYAAITVLAISGANIWNMLKSRGYVRLSFKHIEIRKHLKPLFYLFLAAAIGNVYAMLDTVLLGFLAGDKAAGFYAIDRKLIAFIITFVVSLGTVLVPRLSYYIQNNRMNEYNNLAEKSINFIFMLAFPAIAGLICLAPQIIGLFGGGKFVEASLSLRIIAPIIFIISLNSFIGFQVLIPNNREKYMFFANCIGAVVNVALNLLLAGKFLQNGSALAIAVSETAVLITQLALGRKLLTFAFFNRRTLNYIIGSLMIVITIFVIKFAIKGNMLVLFLSGILSALFYVGFLLLRKDELAFMIVRRIPIMNKLIK